MSKEQINLPKTTFSMKANLPTREPEILELWKKINLYKELRNSRKGAEKFFKALSPRDFAAMAWSTVKAMASAFGRVLK